MLKGTRQVGKTYILKEWGQENFEKVHYVNFETHPLAAKIFDRDFDVSRILNELSFLLNTSISAKQNELLIFDEIQAAPKTLTSLKYFCENLPELAVCSAGSLLGVTLSEESFPLGKIDFLYMFPLNFTEFTHAIDDRESWRYLNPPSFEAEIPELVHEHLYDLLKLYFITGGMPEAVKQLRDHRSDLHLAYQRIREVQHGLLTGYENDFAKHAGKLNAVHIQALYRNVPSQLSSNHDDTTKRFRFGEVMSGKKGFAAWERPLNWLINAGLIIDVKIANSAQQPLEHYSKPNQFKLFMHDIGLLACAQNLDPAALILQDYGSAKGYFIENFVAQEMRSSHLSLDYPLFSWSEGTSEIEFVRHYQADVIPLEVKSGHRTKAKSFHQFRLRYNPPLAVKLSRNNFYFDKENKVLNLPLYLASWAALL